MFDGHKHGLATSIYIYHWRDHDRFEAALNCACHILDIYKDFKTFRIYTLVNIKPTIRRWLESVTSESELVTSMREFREELESTTLNENIYLTPEYHHFKFYIISRNFIYYDKDGTPPILNSVPTEFTFDLNQFDYDHGSDTIFSKKHWGEYAIKNVQIARDFLMGFADHIPEVDFDPVFYLRPVWRFIPLKAINTACEEFKEDEAYDIMQKLRSDIPKEPILEVLERNSVEFRELPDDRVFVRFGETWDDLQYDYKTVFRDVKKAVKNDLRRVGLR